MILAIAHYLDLQIYVASYAENFVPVGSLEVEKDHFLLLLEILKKCTRKNVVELQFDWWCLLGLRCGWLCALFVPSGSLSSLCSPCLKLREKHSQLGLERGQALHEHVPGLGPLPLSFHYLSPHRFFIAR